MSIVNRATYSTSVCTYKESYIILLVSFVFPLQLLKVATFSHCFLRCGNQSPNQVVWTYIIIHIISYKVAPGMTLSYIDLCMQQKVGAIQIYRCVYSPRHVFDFILPHLLLYRRILRWDLGHHLQRAFFR